jgi:hypothetical protein
MRRSRSDQVTRCPGAGCLAHTRWPALFPSRVRARHSLAFSICGAGTSLYLVLRLCPSPTAVVFIYFYLGFFYQPTDLAHRSSFTATGVVMAGYVSPHSTLAATPNACDGICSRRISICSSRETASFVSAFFGL